MRHRHTVRRQIVGLLGQGRGGGISPDARESTGRTTDATRYVHCVAFLLFICTVPSNSTMLLYISYCMVYGTLLTLVPALSAFCYKASSLIWRESIDTERPWQDSRHDAPLKRKVLDQSNEPNRLLYNEWITYYILCSMLILPAPHHDRHLLLVFLHNWSILHKSSNGLAVALRAYFCFLAIRLSLLGFFFSFSCRAVESRLPR